MKKKNFLVFDCETATMSFANELAHGDSERKKRIAIARPLIYNPGWTQVDRNGNISDRKEFLVAETFAVPSVFNTAYYADKRPIYLEKIARGELTVLPWNDIMKIFLADLEKVDAVGAFNSMFDFKKAIPFTDLYIKHLYSPDYYEWEKTQYNICRNIANNTTKQKSENDFEPDVFRFRGKVYPLFDLWGLSTAHLLNNASYKKECLNHDMLTASGTYFKTSAESTYRYLMNKYDFDEAHTALEDAEIESFILSKIAARHAITPGITFFPFRELGMTTDFVQRRVRPDVNECMKVIDAINAYIDSKIDTDTAYIVGLRRKIDELLTYMGQ